MEERMSEKKNMTGKENSFHMENFRRRSRYAAVFLVLILAFAAITVLNINSGNVNISIPEIFRILLLRTGAHAQGRVPGQHHFRADELRRTDGLRLRRLHGMLLQDPDRI